MKTTSLFWGIALGFSLVASAASKRPNIVLIVADDLGYGDVSCNGATRVETPNIDSLARNGLRLTSGYCTASTCTPTRYSLITGKYAFRQRGVGIAPPNAPALIKPGTESIASLLKRAGYATAIIGKWHLGLGEGKPDWNGELKPGPLEIGFDYCALLPTTNDRVPQVIVENHRVRNLDPKDPLFVTMRKPSPDHPTGVTHRKSLRMDWSFGHNCTIHNGIGRIGYYTGGHSARFRDEDLCNIWVKEVKQWVEKNREKPFFLLLTTHDVHVPRMPNERFQGKSKLGPRGDMILEFDWTVGQVREILRKNGLDRDTLMVVTSDNGPVLDDGYKDRAVELNGDHRPAGPFKGGKYTIHEGGTRMPFIAYWPGVISPGVSDKMVSTVDFAASFAALVGQRVPDDGCVDSFNMIDVLLGKPGAKGRPEIIGQDNGASRIYIRQGNMKLTASRNKKRGLYPTGLFDLGKDIHEERNLKAQRPKLAKKMLADLEARIRAGRTRPPAAD